MSWLTELIAHIDPQAALKREQARRAYQMVKSTGRRAYDAASKSRRTAGWKATGASATAENAAAASTVRYRSRELVRNDAYATRGVNIITECAVGSGIIPEPDTGSDAKDRAIKAAFEEFQDECDADEQLDFYGMQDLICQTIVMSGDALIRRRPRRSADGLYVPLQLQVMEPDHLDMARQANGGNDVIAGIELDALNHRLAYWLYPTHPGEVQLLRRVRFESVRVSAENVAHAYRKTRPGEMIGMPWLAPVMIDLNDLRDYEGAEQIRKKVEACFSAFVTRNDTGAALRTLGDDEEDDDGRLERVEPGMIEYLEPGESVVFGQPSNAAGYDLYTRQRLHKIATGLQMPYMLLTGDVSQANWSSYKAGIVPFKGMIRRFQKRTLLPMALRPVWWWFIESAFAAGRIGDLDYRVKWTLPGFEPIDRQKEAMADMLEVRMGKSSMIEIIRQRGGNPDTVLDEAVSWFSKTDEREVVFDSDPRKVSQQGHAHHKQSIAEE